MKNPAPPSAAPTATHDVVVTIDSGAVRGRWRGTPGAAGSSAAFRGIPFAQAPVGALRFAAPVPVEPWEGTRDALAYGATAQRGDTGPTLIPEPSVAGESTLNVNVVTPDPTAAALPVLVWIHGGGFVAGSPASPWYDGAAFARAGIVTVAISYRLGFDGFGHIAGAPSNRGVLDWLAALEWVQRNIAAFGGDPARVTIAGQSAGGGAVLTLLALPAAQHLFHAAWALSGAIADVPQARAVELSENLARLADVSADRDGFAAVEEESLRRLQDAAATPLTDDPMAGLVSLLHDGLPWGPVVDGDLLTEPTLDALRAGVGADKPLVLGSTDDEFTMATDAARGRLRFVPAQLALGRLGVDRATRRAYLAANAPQRRKGTAAVLGRFVTDRVFRSTVLRVAEARASAPTWVYRFTWASPTRRWALHCLDVPFWFDCLADEHVAAIAGDSPPQALADDLHGAAVSLITSGGPGWEAWSERAGATRVFDGESRGRIIDDGYSEVRALV